MTTIPKTSLHMQYHTATDSGRTREQEIAAALLKWYRPEDAYRHAANMHKKDAYKKIGVSYDAVRAELDLLTKTKTKKPKK